MAYKWVVAQRISWTHDIEATGFSADDLREATSHARFLADVLYPGRQISVWRNISPPEGGPPRWGYTGQKPNLVTGATDAELYERCYGKPMPLNSAVGTALFSGLDDNLTA